MASRPEAQVAHQLVNRDAPQLSQPDDGGSPVGNGLFCLVGEPQQFRVLLRGEGASVPAGDEAEGLPAPPSQTTREDRRVPLLYECPAGWRS